MRRLLLFLLLFAVFAAAWVGYRANDRPSLEPYADLFLQDAASHANDASTGNLRVTFLGVSTLLFDDGETAVLTDGFFSRPGLLETIAGEIEPDTAIIAESLRRAAARNLAAVIVVHSHYDHVMDAPEVALRTGATLVGSESTANVGRGWGLPEERIIVVGGGETVHAGRFHVTLVKSRHFPHGMAMGKIAKPLRPPARATAYREGGSFSVLVNHDDRTVLLQASAGFVPGALEPYDADVVFLGLAGLGTRDTAYREAYWLEIVQAVGARRVIPVHWDDFTLPLDEPIVPLPRLVDDFDETMRFLRRRALEAGIDLKMVHAWQRFDPFAGL